MNDRPTHTVAHVEADPRGGPRAPLPGPRPARAAVRTAGTYRGLLARVQDELVAARTRDARRCALCGLPLHAAQNVEQVRGSAVHARCRRARSTAGARS